MSIRSDNIHIIKFRDSRGISQAIKVKKKIFDIFDENKMYEMLDIKNTSMIQNK